MNVPTAKVLLGKCSERLPQVNKWLKQKTSAGAVCVYVNPPRTGIEKELIKWITEEAQPDKIAYLSCSTGSLERDLVVLTQNNYNVIHIQPYDFFPITHHVECLVFLEYQK